MQAGSRIRDAFPTAAPLRTLYKGWVSNWTSFASQNATRLPTLHLIESLFPTEHSSLSASTLKGFGVGCLGDTVGQHPFFVRRVLKMTQMPEAHLPFHRLSPSLLTRGLVPNSLRNGWGFAMAYGPGRFILNHVPDPYQNNPLIEFSVYTAMAYTGLLLTVPGEMIAIRKVNTGDSYPNIAHDILKSIQESGIRTGYRGFCLKGIVIALNNWITLTLNRKLTTHHENVAK